MLLFKYSVSFYKSLKARKFKVREKKVNEEQLQCTLTDIGICNLPN